MRYQMDVQKGHRIAAYREREKSTSRQMNEILGRLPPVEKIILMGHCRRLVIS
jgi:hypothetical protein